MAILAVTGMASEARVARRAGLSAIVIAGPVPGKLQALEEAITRETTGLVSFGIAGALDPALPSGAILTPEAVRIEAGTLFRCDGAWRERLLTVAPGPRPHRDGDVILGASHIIASARDKTALFRRTGAVAVDLESGFVAEAAARAGLPFLVVRIIADPATRDLPPAALIGLDPRGRPALGAVLRSVAARPGQIPALFRLAAETARALRALALAAGAIAPSGPA